MTVFQKTAAGLKQQGAPQLFRVKKFPNPPLRINGVNIDGSTDMKAADARNISALGLDVANLDFKATFRVLDFSLTMGTPGGSIRSFHCQGNQVSEEARRELAKLKPGARLYFEDIKVQTPDEIRSFPMAKITVK